MERRSLLRTEQPKQPHDPSPPSAGHIDRVLWPMLFENSKKFVQLESTTVPFDRELIEAKLSLKLIACSDMPRIAWDALEAGLDGPAIRHLAALVQPTYFEVAEVLPRAMEGLGLTGVNSAKAALRIAKRLAADILQSGDDPLTHIRDFEWLWIRADYAGELSPVGNLVDEVWIAQSTGQSSDELIREWVTERFRDLARPESQPDTLPLQSPESGR